MSCFPLQAGIVFGEFLTEPKIQSIIKGVKIQQLCVEELKDSLEKKIDVVEEKINSVEEKIALKLKEKIAVVEEKIDKKVEEVEEKIEKKVEQVEEKIEMKVEQVEEKIEKKVEQVEERIEGVVENFSLVPQRMEHLEKKFLVGGNENKSKSVHVSAFPEPVLASAVPLPASPVSVKLST
ncbi:hypothetical protein TNCV_3068731 [Trichonephila clavipes]|nr:hypothetical protein TNCV_3068731 [Trichonephila clavipes]